MELLISVLIAVAIILIFGLLNAQELLRTIVFRLGRYPNTTRSGLYWIIPMIYPQQTIANNTTTVILMPSEFTNAAKSFSDMVSKQQKTND